MISYTPPDVPPAIVKFANEHIKKPNDVTRRYFRYFMQWNQQELYITRFYYKDKHAERPAILVYNCKDVRYPTFEERLEINIIYPKYISSFIRPEHLCHRDKKAFNQHTKPSDYNIKVEHVNPKYVPQKVISYIDKIYNDNWYPGANKRKIRYLTTWKEYDVYQAYWSAENPKRKSYSIPILYNGQEARRIDFEELNDKTFNYKKTNLVFARPHLHNKD